MLQGQRPPRREERKRIRKLTQPTAAGRQHVSAEDIREELFGKDDDDDGGDWAVSLCRKRCGLYYSISAALRSPCSLISAAT